MTTFDMVVVLGGVCGLLMVAGGMILLYRGVITLTAAADKEAVSLEFRQMLKVTSHYPALGLFIIGLAFIIIAAFFAEPPKVSPVTLTGNIENVVDPSSATLHVFVDLGQGEVLTDGRIQQVIFPNLAQFRVEIVAPGYSPPKKVLNVGNSDIRGGVASLGTIRFDNKIGDKPPVNPGNIAAPAAPLPPLTAQGGF